MPVWTCVAGLSSGRLLRVWKQQTYTQVFVKYGACKISFYYRFWVGLLRCIMSFQFFCLILILTLRTCQYTISNTNTSLYNSVWFARGLGGLTPLPTAWGRPPLWNLFGGVGFDPPEGLKEQLDKTWSTKKFSAHFAHRLFVFQRLNLWHRFYLFLLFALNLVSWFSGRSSLPDVYNCRSHLK